MMHTVFIPVLILLHVSAMMVLGRVLHGKSLAGWFVFFNDVYFLFCSFSGYMDADFLLSILWQWKSVYLLIVLPVLSGFMIQKADKTNGDDRTDRYYPVQLLIIIAAGLSCNPTSLYVMGFEMAALAVADAILNKRLMSVRSMIPAVTFVVYP